ncbi:MAG: sugar ABC transporter permease [Oscillospiraceae bacterium]|nr:sugar ABC transporter permease [Oscillospiraceae bacterium]MCL2279428.1 sugar ABC transporter permease [Oscillospiraceae bacterium]
MGGKTGKHTPIFFLFLLPVMLAFTIIIVVPLIMGVYYSFTDWNAVPGTPINWVGLENYFVMFSDVSFLHSFLVTVAFSLVCILLINFIAFMFALLVTAKLKFAGVYRAGFFLPNLIGGIVLGYIWFFIFNNAITAIGSTVGSDFLAMSFLGNRFTSLFAMIIVTTWQMAGYIMMIYVAAIQSVPASLLEAAQIDGAKYHQRLRYILMPLIAPAFTITLFLTLVNSFRMFDVNFALTAGGPSGLFMGQALWTTELLALNIFNTAHRFNDFAQGQARAIIFFIALMTISLIQVYFNKRKEIEM